MSDSQELIEAAWKWLSINMIPQLEEISSPFAREEWVVKKMNQIVSATIAGTVYFQGVYDMMLTHCNRQRHG